MRRLGLLLVALALVSAVSTAPARALDCGGRAALSAGCCCKEKAPAPPKAPCCQASPAEADAAVLSAGAAVVPLVVAATALLPEPPRIAEAPGPDGDLDASPPGSTRLFLLDCTFRI